MKFMIPLLVIMFLAGSIYSSYRIMKMMNRKDPEKPTVREWNDED
ncbi:hypothetical protein [Succinimonas amylolytica]|nr:hypothetical protein [Succinimonas amylolytica]